MMKLAYSLALRNKGYSYLSGRVMASLLLTTIVMFVVCLDVT